MSNYETADEAYVRIAEDILVNGDVKGDRTGVGTHATFGQTARFDLSNNQFPIITTKRVYWKTAVREMLWFLTGDTNIRKLLQVGVTIWSEWPHKKYCETTGDNLPIKDFEQKIVEDEEFAMRWGDLGPVYGSIWRKWVGGKCTGCHGYGYWRGHVCPWCLGSGLTTIDQIAVIQDQLKNNPNSRRIILEGWKVDELDKMLLPPCHKSYQFVVTSDGKLNSFLYARSQDFLLGTPFNWIGQAVLQLMFASVAKLTPADMVWIGVDTHFYFNHIEQAKLQISREPKTPPQFKIINHRDSIFDFTIDDFEMIGYDPHPPIAAEVAV